MANISGSSESHTNLPAAAALADGTANPTVPSEGSFVQVFNTSTWERARTHLTSDGVTSPVAGLTGTAPTLYNGSTYDRWYGNTVVLTALASAARTASVLSGALVNPTGRGILILLNVSAVGTGQITSMEIYDGTTNFLLYQFSGLAISTTGYRAFLIYPGAATAGSFTAAPIQGTIPRSFQIQISWLGGNTGSVTFDLKYHLIV